MRAPALALFILAGLLLAMVAGIFAQAADARADFDTYADRNTRPTEPVGWDVNGTAVHLIVDWNGTHCVGNLGIGNGDTSLMDPDVINRAIGNASAGLNTSDTSANGTAGNATPDGEHGSEGKDHDDATGRGFRETSAENTTAQAEVPEETKEAWESLLPRHVAAASFITRGEPYSITINEPYPHILNEDPREPGVLYAKLLGLSLPGGRMMDMGIKSLGTEF